MEINNNLITFIVEYYEILQENENEIKELYNEGSKILIIENKQNNKNVSNSISKQIPIGKRRILKYSGEEIGKNLFIHIQSEIEQPYKKLIIDEIFNCLINEFNIIIQYHSIHINPILDPIINLLPINNNNNKINNNKIIENFKPIEVNSPEEINQTLSILVTNLSYKIAPSNFLNILNKYGKIIKYCQSKGILLVEYSNKKEMYAAISCNSYEFEGRTVYIKRCPKELRWN